MVGWSWFHSKAHYREQPTSTSCHPYNTATLALTASFRNNLGNPVTEYRIILDFVAAGDDGDNSDGNWNS